MRPAARHRPCRAAAGAAILVIAAPVLSACSGAADRTEPTAAAAAIEIRTFIFSPDPLEVPPGTEVTFTNADTTTHTVTAGTRAAPTGEFDASLDGAESFTRVFDKPGTYEYFCDLHPGDGMTGTIVVG